MNRLQKAEQVGKLKEIFSSTEIVLLIKYSGVTVADMSNFRRSALNNGVFVKVIKNNLAKISLVDTDFSGLKEHVFGPVAIVYSDNVVAAAKVVSGFAKKNEKIEVLSASMNKATLSKEEVKALSELPSIDELRGKIVGLLVAPATKLAGVIQAPAGGLARVISAYSKKS